MMLISGLFSIVVIGVLFANMLHYIDDVNAADQAVKICQDQCEYVSEKYQGNGIK